MKNQSEVGAANRAVREAAKRWLRYYGEATAALRRGPDFIVIGAKRGGTTSLYSYLLEHPSIQPLFPGRQRIKGPHYFDSEFARGPRWYRSHFPLTVGGRQIAQPVPSPALAGEASPYYLFHPLAAERLAAEYPGVPLIVLLRDPAERAYSHYKERVQNVGETLTFEEALDAEPERLHGEAERIIAQPGYRSAEHENHSYVAQGRYVDMLLRWFSLFPREQFYIAFSEDFYAQPERIVNEIWSFLGLPPAPLRSRKRHNYQPAPDLLPATRRRLEDAFAEHSRGLEELLGRRPPWRSVSPACASVTPRWPSVTAVVATRNRPEQLQQAVRSIMAQAYPGDIECVVVFDQSAPASVDAGQTDGRRVRVMTNTRTPGLAGARNTGILASDADLIAFCDDDDTWAAGKLRLQAGLLAATSASFAGSGVRFHYSGHVTEREAPGLTGFSDLARSRISALHPSGFLMRREFVSAIGLVDEEIPGSHAEDYDLLLRVAQKELIVAVQEPLVNVHWHRQSYFAERWEAIVEALEYLLRKHPALLEDPQGFARIQGQIAFAQAALGRRAATCRSVIGALRKNPLERRAYLALAIAVGIAPAGTTLRIINRKGRGI